MLMGNASKILQTVAANIDRDVFDPLLNGLVDVLMLSDAAGWLKGDENIQVKGVNVAIQRETERSRQLEFLQITANPIDSGIVGIKGRANLLRQVSANIGMDGQEIVPSAEEIDARLEAEARAAAQAEAPPPEGETTEMAAAGAKAQGAQAPQGGNVTGDMGPRTNITGGAS
jgi:hypothetical protein